MAKNTCFTTHWTKLNSLLLMTATFWWMLNGQLGIIPIAGIISFMILFVIHAKIIIRGSLLQNLANIVSGLRLMLTLSLFLVIFEYPPQYIGFLGLIILLADGLDGFLARKFNGHSLFGTYLDMETDALFILTLCVFIITFNLAGKWVLIPGLMRYIYVFIYPFRKRNHKEPRSYRGQAIAVLLMVSLIFCFLLPGKIYLPLLFGATILTLFSFLADIRILFVSEPSTLSN